jgi:hypothetical protein
MVTHRASKRSRAKPITASTGKSFKWHLSLVGLAEKLDHCRPEILEGREAGSATAGEMLHAAHEWLEGRTGVPAELEHERSSRRKLGSFGDGRVIR